MEKSKWILYLELIYMPYKKLNAKVDICSIYNKEEPCVHRQVDTQTDNAKSIHPLILIKNICILFVYKFDYFKWSNQINLAAETLCPTHTRWILLWYPILFTCILNIGRQQEKRLARLKAVELTPKTIHRLVAKFSKRGCLETSKPKIKACSSFLCD